MKTFRDIMAILSMDDKERISYLEKKVNELQNELEETKAHLKRYTAPSSSKIYYEKHKEEQKQRVKEHKERTGYKYTPTPEQKARYYENLKIARAKKREEKKAAKLKENV
jgi:hypothetical protein